MNIPRATNLNYMATAAINATISNYLATTGQIRYAHFIRISNAYPNEARGYHSCKLVNSLFNDALSDSSGASSTGTRTNHSLRKRSRISSTTSL